MKRVLTGYGKTALKALWLPFLWLLLLIIELSFFSHKENLSLPARLFEDLVFITSFLFYNTKGLMGYLENPVQQAVISFSLQFFFWWAIAFFYLTVLKTSKK